MIKDKLENISRYNLGSHFEELIQYVQSDLKNQTSLKVIPLEYETKDWNLSKFENHQKNIDVHIILEGKEKIGIASLNELEPSTPFNEDGDYQLFNGKEIAQEIVMLAGEFLVLWPGEAHLTGGLCGESSFISKRVIKIPIQ